MPKQASLTRRCCRLVWGLRCVAKRIFCLVARRLSVASKAHCLKQCRDFDPTGRRPSGVEAWITALSAPGGVLSSGPCRRTKTSAKTGGRVRLCYTAWKCNLSLRSLVERRCHSVAGTPELRMRGGREVGIRIRSLCIVAPLLCSESAYWCTSHSPHQPRLGRCLSSLSRLRRSWNVGGSVLIWGRRTLEPFPDAQSSRLLSPPKAPATSHATSPSCWVHLVDRRRRVGGLVAVAGRGGSRLGAQCIGSVERVPRSPKEAQRDCDDDDWKIIY